MSVSGDRGTRGDGIAGTRGGARPRRILLVRLSAIGDVVHGLHGLAALRSARPDATIGFLVEDKATTLLENHPDADRVHVYPRRRWQRNFRRAPATVLREVGAFLSELRAARYDVAVDLQGNLKSGMLSCLAGVPRRIGLAAGCGKEGSHRFATEHVRVPASGFHRVDRVLRLLAPLGVTGPGRVHRVPATPADRETVSRFLAGLDLVDGGFAVLHPATSRRGARKRWPPEHYAVLANRLLDELGLRSVVTYGPGEEELAGAVVAGAGGTAVLAPPLPRLSALAELLRRAGLFVAGDTGALHLAAFLGTPTLGLYGPMDPAVYSPRGPRTAVVYRGPAGGGARTGVPMDSITPDDAMNAARDLVGGDAPGETDAERGIRWQERNPGRSEARPAAGRCS